MSFVVELSPAAKTDLERLFDFLLDHAEMGGVNYLDRSTTTILAGEGGE